MVDSAKLIELIQSIYDAALDPSLWTDFLDKAAAEMHATHSLLLLLDADSLSEDVVLVRGLDPAVEIEYQNRVEEDIWANAVFTKPPGTAWLSEELVDPKDLHQTAFYADIARPSKCEHNVVAAISDSSPKMLFSFIRGKQHGPYGERDKRILQHLVPHLANARRVHHRLSGTLTLVHGIKQALDRSPYGVAVVGASGAVEYMNAGMDKLLANSSDLVLLNKRLQLKGTDDQRRFEERIRYAIIASLQDLDVRRANALLSPITLAGHQITVVPLSQRSKDSFTRKPCCLVYISHPMLHGSVSADALRGIFGLTPAESLVCEALVQGGSLRDAALARGITMNTARTHLKNIFQKCDVHSQAQLVERVSTSLATLADR